MFSRKKKTQENVHGERFMKSYKINPGTVEAIQFTGNNAFDIIDCLKCIKCVVGWTVDERFNRFEGKDYITEISIRTEKAKTVVLRNVGPMTAIYPQTLWLKENDWLVKTMDCEGEMLSVYDPSYFEKNYSAIKEKDQ